MAKQVIVVRMDLAKKMRKGKFGAQVGHAVMAPILNRGTIVTRSNQGKPEKRLEVSLTDAMAAWMEGRFKKILLGVDTEADLLECFQLAREAGLPVALITDAGFTEFKKPCEPCGGSGEVEIGKSPYDTAVLAPCYPCGGSGKVPEPTNTCIGIGPAWPEDIDAITGPEGAMKDKVRLI